MSKYCGGTGERLVCPHPDKCTESCWFNDATRKIKPYPAVPDDIQPVPEAWQTVGTGMLTAIMGVLAVICLALFFTGVWLWEMLV
jgi:hypothetical protein